MPRPLVATIDITAMRHNLMQAKHCARGAKVWAVVKANAYGHGLARAVQGFSDADGFALIEFDNAVRLREMGWRKPILLLEGFFEQNDLHTASNYELQVTVHSSEQVDMLEHTNLPNWVDVHLKMNSGMNRLGFLPDIYQQTYKRLRAIDTVRNISLMNHFANGEDADNPALPLAQQLQRFRAASVNLPGERSLSNSAITLLHPEVDSDWIRPGIMLYGGTPGIKTAEEFGLRPAMTLHSELIGLQNVAAGESVGYGSRFVADKPMRIGVVACGYADGYPRHAPTGTPIIVNECRTRIVGRVSMDMMTVDLTEIPAAQVGSKVILWGEGLPIDEVANAAGTISYELMCALAARVRIVER